MDLIQIHPDRCLSRRSGRLTSTLAFYGADGPAAKTESSQPSGTCQDDFSVSRLPPMDPRAAATTYGASHRGM
jgi:hypothetical protein